MIVWTIQPYEVYEEILEKGEFACDPRLSANLSEGAEFRRSYQWMIQQMIEKIGKAEKVGSYPVWAWYRRDYQRKRPDFRERRDYPDEVCIELDIPDEKVLLSDFDAWHFVLNDLYYSNATNDAEWERQAEWFSSLSEKEQEQVKEESWKRIFDISPRFGDWEHNGRMVQACFWKIEKAQVRKVWRLKEGERVYEIDCL